MCRERYVPRHRLSHKSSRPHIACPRHRRHRFISQYPLQVSRHIDNRLCDSGSVHPIPVFSHTVHHPYREFRNCPRIFPVNKTDTSPQTGIQSAGETAIMQATEQALLSFAIVFSFSLYLRTSHRITKLGSILDHSPLMGKSPTISKNLYLHSGHTDGIINEQNLVFTYLIRRRSIEYRQSASFKSSIPRNSGGA